MEHCTTDIELHAYGIPTHISGAIVMFASHNSCYAVTAMLASRSSTVSDCPYILFDTNQVHWREVAVAGFTHCDCVVVRGNIVGGRLLAQR